MGKVGKLAEGTDFSLFETVDTDGTLQLHRTTSPASPTRRPADATADDWPIGTGKQLLYGSPGPLWRRPGGFPSSALFAFD